VVSLGDGEGSWLFFALVLAYGDYVLHQFGMPSLDITACCYCYVLFVILVARPAATCFSFTHACLAALLLRFC
jgi:hypothetical protein